MHPFTLRPLTLGVLIVVGGTLAALPFRRYQPAGELASSAASSSDGPIGSSLTSAPLQADPRPRSLEPEPLRGQAPHRSEQRSSAVPRQRPMHSPLTYEDIAVPLDPSRAARQRPGAEPAGAADRNAAGAAGAAPRDFRPKATLPPETDLQPLALSEPPPAAGLAGTGAVGPRSVLAPTSAGPPAAEHPAASPRRQSSEATESNKSSKEEPKRLAEDARPLSASQRHEARDRNRRADDAPPKPDGSREANSGALASTKLSGSDQKLSVADQPSSHDERKRYWIHQPQ